MNWEECVRVCIAAGGVAAVGASSAVAADFRVKEAVQVQEIRTSHLSGEEPPAPAPLSQGQLIRKPWTGRTGPEGSLVLLANGQRMAVYPNSKVELPDHPDATPPAIQSALKAAEIEARRGRNPSRVDLLLLSGTLVCASGGEKSTLKTPNVHVVAESALYSLSQNADDTTRLHVFAGKVRVHTRSGFNKVLQAGQQLSVFAQTPPSLGLLENTPEIDALRSHALLLGEIPADSPKAAATASPNTVGGGGVLTFDLRTRRDTALLRAPNPSNFNQPDVSPELPAPPLPSVSNP